MLLQRGIFGDLTFRRRKRIGPGVGVRGPNPTANRNLRKNDWDKQGGENSGFGRRPMVAEWRRELGEHSAIYKKTE